MATADVFSFFVTVLDQLTVYSSHRYYDMSGYELTRDHQLNEKSSSGELEIKILKKRLRSNLESGTRRGFALCHRRFATISISF